MPEADIFLSMLLYTALFAGVYLIFFDWINYYPRLAIKELRRKHVHKESALLLHLEKIFSVISRKGNAKRDMNLFILSSLALFLVFFLLLMKQGFSINKIGISAVIGLMPYCYIRTKLLTLRISGSFEGQILISEIVNQYKMNHFNIIEALDKSVSHLEKAPLSAKALLRMSLRLKTYQTEKELRTIIDDFVYALDTEWAKMLANNIYIAMVDKVTVTSGLEDLLRECKTINKALEEGKRMNNESFLMAKYLGPVMYVGLMWLAKDALEYDLGMIIKYQLFTSAGLMLFIVLTAITFINFIVISVLSRQKFDF